jgi:lipoprotein-anchoring transpeptidase ErfK/SrfK
MARRQQYRRLHSNGNRGGGKFLALLLLLMAGFGFWALWHFRSTSRQPPPTSPPTVAPHTNQTFAPVMPAPARTNPPPTPSQPVTNMPPTNAFPRPPRDVLEAQVALARLTISPGSLDGVMGSQTRAAILAWQRKLGLPETLELDADTKAGLSLDAPPLTRCVVTSNDLARLQPLSKTWLGKSQQTALDYETILELVAERGYASPNLIRRLNPNVDWTNVMAGTEIQIPAAEYPQPATKAAFVVISLGEKKLEAFDVGTNLLAHFPCSIAARVEKRPAGELHVSAIAENPNYTFDPEVFPESAEARELGRKLILPPGPNNPVGTAWISLDKPGYGMHGTPNPEQVGRTESHGCFRLANWNASQLVKLVWIGMPVYVEP